MSRDIMQEANIIEYAYGRDAFDGYKVLSENLCKKDKSIIVGGKFCTELCGNFKGHYIKRKSLLCDWEG